MKHYTIDELDAYTAGEMNILAKLKCTAHLKNCQECQALLQQSAKNDQLVERLKESWAKLTPELLDSNWEKSYARIARKLK